MKGYLSIFVIFICISSMFADAQSTVPPLVNYQGTLTNADGTVFSGSKKIEFNIYDDAFGGGFDFGFIATDGICDVGDGLTF